MFFLNLLTDWETFRFHPVCRKRVSVTLQELYASGSFCVYQQTNCGVQIISWAALPQQLGMLYALLIWAVCMWFQVCLPYSAWYFYSARLKNRVVIIIIISIAQLISLGDRAMLQPATVYMNYWKDKTVPRSDRSTRQREELTLLIIFASVVNFILKVFL